MSVSEYEFEPVRGLPGQLPEGETLVWQGSPDRRIMARRVFHLRTVSIYLAVLITTHIVIQISQGGALASTLLGSSWMVALGLVAIGILYGLAWAYSRSTVYTITNQRLVLRFGVAMPMMVNIPLNTVNAADMRRFADGSGDIVLSLQKRKRLSYILLWPNVKSWQFSPVQPALRSLVDADGVAAALASVVQLGSALDEADTAAESSDDVSGAQMLGA